MHCSKPELSSVGFGGSIVSSTHNNSKRQTFRRRVVIVGRNRLRSPQHRYSAVGTLIRCRRYVAVQHVVRSGETDGAVISSLLQKKKNKKFLFICSRVMSIAAVVLLRLDNAISALIYPILDVVSHVILRWCCVIFIFAYVVQHTH